MSKGEIGVSAASRGIPALFFWVVEGFEGATEHEREQIFELTDYPHEKIIKELGTVMRIDLLKKRDPEKFEELCKEHGIK